MNWFKNAIDTEWQQKGIYHFLNVMKFEIDSFPNLSLDSTNGVAGSDRVGFSISRNGENEYSFTIRMNGNNIDTIITAKPLRSLGAKSYDATSTTPQQIVDDGLATINNDYTGEFEYGMV